MKFSWRRLLALGLFLLAGVCDGGRDGRSPGVRRRDGVAAATRYVTSNGLSEAEQPPAFDYESLLETMNGDFGVRSDVVESATSEPEYHGDKTLVVPLYIPEGAVPISLARIPRSGSPDSVVELVDMKVSPSADSVLIRRLGPASGGRSSPLRRPTWRPSQRTRISRLPSIRRSDLVSQRPVTIPTTAPNPLLARFGQRISSPKAAPLIALRRTPITQGVTGTADESGEDGEEESNKRSKKNELSKDSQFHHNISGTVSNNTNTNSSSSTTEPTITTHRPTSASTTTTTESARRTLKPTTSPTTTIPPATTSTKTSTTTTTRPTTEITRATSTTTTRPTTPITTQTPPSTTEENSTPSDRRFVHFPRPVESILKKNKQETTTVKPSSTTTTTTTTSASTTTTTTTTASPRRGSPIRFRPWLARQNGITSTETANSSSESPSTTTALPSPSPLTTESSSTAERSRTPTSKKPLASTSEEIEVESYSSTSTTTPATITTEAPPVTTRRPPLITTMKRPTTTTVTTEATIKTSTSATTSTSTTRRVPFLARRPDDSLPPVRKMPSVEDILGDAKKEDQEVVTESSPKSSTTTATAVPTLEATANATLLNKEPPEDMTNERTEESEGDNQRIPNGKGDEPADTDGIDTENEDATPPRKALRWPRPQSHNPNGRRWRVRPRTTSPSPLTHESDVFKVPAEFVAVSTATEATDAVVTISSSKFPFNSSTTSSPEPTEVTNKPPEEIVIESLTEIMKEATANNKSKDKFLTIAGNLEALNKQLAERGIHIIHAEIDGVRIKLDNRTLSRPLASPFPVPTTFRPTVEFNLSLPDSFSTTEDPSTSLSSPPAQSSVETEEDVDKQTHTSVKTSFSIHTSKPTDVEDETDSANEVQSTTNDSSFATTKPIELKKFTEKPVRGDSLRPTLSTSFVPDDATEGNRTRQEETPSVSDNSSVRTSAPSGNREKEEEGAPSLPSFVISATSTVPASVTTRTRSTTVPVTTHRPTVRPFSFTSEKTSSAVFPFDETSVDDVMGEELVTEPEDLTPGKDSTLHPTSHNRPISLPALPETSTEKVNAAHTPRDPSVAIVIEEKVEKNTSSKGGSTTRRPIIEVISITQEIQEPSYVPGSVAVADDMAREEFSETTSSASSSSTAVYIIGVIGLIPAAGLAAFLAKKFLKKKQKALPESEERAEGFTPVTHHARKPSHSNTLDLEPSSVEAKNPKYTPWEFPRSKLRLVSILGEGNFGVVWKAEARELCACEGATGGPTVLVAVKGVKDGAGQKEKQDLLKELAIMQHIGQHPNVVTLLGCCTQQEPYYVIMEYVMFGKLLTFLRDHRTRHNYYNFSSDTEALTSRDLTRFACQIATGCDYLQNRGIIHRDLASRNILVDHNKVCKIADFGLARSVKDLGSDIYEQKSRGALPIRWMAPESLYMSIFTHKSDVWSFGILCWEIVTLGSTPYPGMTAREVMRRVREGYRLDRPEHCRPELYRIVTKCWHQDLNKRPTFSELKVELATLLDNQPGYIIDLENFPEGSYYSMHENNEEKL